MSRFFVDDNDSEEDEEEEASLKDVKESILEDSEFKHQIDPILDSITTDLTLFLNNISKEQIDANLKDEMGKLSDSFNKLKSSTANTNFDLPDSILENLVAIKQKLFEESKDPNISGILPQFNEICSNFTSQINKYCENQNSDKEDNGWFVDSDDEDDKNRFQIKIGVKRQLVNGVYVYVDDNQEETIDSTAITRELTSFAEARHNGTIKATTKRLYQLSQASKDPRLTQQVNNEIIYTVSLTPVDQPIDNNNWMYAIDALMNTTLNPNEQFSLFLRLNNDYWARTIDIRYLFIPSTAQLHELFPKFISIMQDYLTHVKVNEYPEAYIRTADILIEHLYGDENEQENVIRLTKEILTYLSTADMIQFTRIQFGLSSFSQDAENIRNRASLFLSYNLSITNQPREAAELFKLIPEIDKQFHHTRILYNRVRAQIGISAFKASEILLSYEMLQKFISIKTISQNIGQEPNSIFPAWMMIDDETIANLLFVSAFLVDLPCLTLNENSVDKQYIHPKMHKDLMKEPIAHPETHLEKAISAASFAKDGEWRQAFDVFKESLNEEFHGVFIDALKRSSLCSFLLNANNYYESISFDFLTQMFELPESDIKHTLELMKQQKSPIGEVPIKFNPPQIVDDKFLVF